MLYQYAVPVFRNFSIQYPVAVAGGSAQKPGAGDGGVGKIRVKVSDVAS